MESPLAVSSYCKSCGAYLSFDDGQIKARAKTVADPFGNRPPQPKVEIEYKPREERGFIPPSKSRPPKPAPSPDPQPESPLGDTPPEVVDEEPTLPPETVAPILDTKTSPSIKTVTAVCFECGDAHEANAIANSTQCRKCGRMISLENFDIKGLWNINVRTRGDVFIHKKSQLASATIECKNLIVEGEFSGIVECSGDLVLRRHAKILGKVSCQRLLVEKRAKIDFLNTIQTNECRIDGVVTGNIVCKGHLTLEKKALLTGDIKVGTLSVADGAKHSGQIQMGGF